VPVKYRLSIDEGGNPGLKTSEDPRHRAGLQIDDLVAHPSFKATLARQNRQSLSSNFGRAIASILREKKYYRSPSGKIYGWGRK
jgi:hypothetical protein